MIRTFLSFLAISMWLAFPAFSGAKPVIVLDPFAQGSGKTGTGYITIKNQGATEDRLIAVRSDAARRVEIHHMEADANGDPKMSTVRRGIKLPAGAEVDFGPAGYHIMFQRLSTPFQPGGNVSVTLIFEHAGDVTIDMPVNNKRRIKSYGGNYGKY